MTRLGILAGRGIYPKLLFDAICRQTNLASKPVVAGLSGQIDRALFREATYAEFPIGAIRRTADYFLKNGVQTLFFAGGIKRDGALKYTRPDRIGLSLLTAALLRGDDSLLRRTADAFESLGVTVGDPAPYIQELLAPEGHLAGPAPTPSIKRDLAIAFNAARELGAKDKGQAAIVKNGMVIATEGRGGTDHLIETTDAVGGVLVKAAKTGQDRRFDLPAIGPNTIQNCHRKGLVALGMDAGSVLMLPRKVSVLSAESLRIVLHGV